MWGKAAGGGEDWSLGLEALAYSSFGLGLTAVGMMAACSLAMRAAPRGELLALGFAGTLVVYTVDRLRDLPRDRLAAPRRTGFVLRHERALRLQVGAAGLVAAGLALHAGPRVAALAALVAGLGLAHRRLKRRSVAKLAYVTLAWTAVSVGLPAVAEPAPRHVGWIALLVASTVSANVWLSSVVDGGAQPGTRRGGGAAGIALALLLPGLLVGLLGPLALRALLAMPAAMALAAAGFRPTERYAALAVDGAVLVGAAIATALASR